MDDWQKAAFEHAWRYFQVHASQRMSHFQFALTFLAAVLAVLGTAYQYQLAVLAKTAAFVGLGALFVFWQLDRRTRQLVKIAEVALLELESNFAEHMKSPVLLLVSNSNKRSWWQLSYTKSFMMLYLTAAAVLVGAAFPSELLGAWEWISARTSALLSNSPVQ